MKLRYAWALLFLLACGSFVSVVRADGLIRDGVGPISTGRGGTNQGFADNSAIILDNPAAMVNVAGNGPGEAGVDTVITSVGFSDPFNDVNSKIRPIPAPVLGFIKKSDDERWAWGLGAFAPAGFGASYGALDNPVTGSNLTRSLGAMGKLLPALSFRATERLSLGLSVGIGFSYASFDGPLILQTAPFTGAPAILDVEGTGVAPVGGFGLQYDLTPNTRIGVAYTEQSNFWMHGATNASVILGPGSVLESRFNSKVQIKWPRSVAAGIKHDLCPHRRISADVIWYDWSQAFSQINLLLYAPSNPVVPLLTDVPIKQVLQLNWTDTVSLRLGYEEQFTPLDTFRCGYVYHSSPSPDSTLNPYLDGILEHAFSLGYSRWLGRASLNLAYQYSFGPQRYVETSGLIGGQWDDTTLDAEAHFAMVSFLWPF
ncbi:MAG: hypothetical protein DWQ37_16675 [Planctomycetota bacterium]|nr:MAG: hypothetical protein DWQ37_16675 [Planctomycetota bacterium]